MAAVSLKSDQYYALVAGKCRPDILFWVVFLVQYVVGMSCEKGNTNY